MRGENLPRRVWNRQTKFTYNYWLAALVKGKCSSTKPTRLTTREVCHPDTEQNSPYKTPWPCRELNRGPTALQAGTLPVCHTTPIRYSCSHILGPHEPIPTKFGLWMFSITFHRYMVSKMLKCKKKKGFCFVLFLVMSSLLYSMGLSLIRL